MAEICTDVPKKMGAQIEITTVDDYPILHWLDV